MLILIIYLNTMDFESCSICCFDLDCETELYNTSCNHKFHKKCIKTWYTYNHESSHNCPMCRSLLNGSEIIQFESSYVEDIENFIRLNGVIVNYNYIIIDTDCSDWKTLLENLMVINTINVKTLSNIHTIKRSSFKFNINGKIFKFGLCIKNVLFKKQQLNMCYNNGKPKISLEFDKTREQYLNIKYIDDILCRLFDISDSVLFKKIEIDGERIERNMMIDMSKCSKQYKLNEDTTISECNYENYTFGICSLMISPVVHDIENQFNFKNRNSRLECVEFALISEITQNNIFGEHIFGKK